MHGAKLTYDILAKSRNPSAIDVLIAGLLEPDRDIHKRALRALVARADTRSCEVILEHWNELDFDAIDPNRVHQRPMAEAVEVALRNDGDFVLAAIEASEKFHLFTTLPKLVLLAESHPSNVVRRRAAEAVLRMVEPLGINARVRRDRTMVRGPVMTRLVESLERFSSHGNRLLIEAFLVASAWGDHELRRLIDQRGRVAELIVKQLQESTHPRSLSLLMGFLKRRDLDDDLAQMIATRTGSTSRLALLETVGATPSRTILRNIQRVGLPVSCRGGESLLQEVPLECIPAIVHLYVSTGEGELETLNLLAAIAELDDSKAVTAAAKGMLRYTTPPSGFWIHAAEVVADGDRDSIESDDAARLLDRLIQLLERCDVTLERGLRRLLAPLHAEQMIDCFKNMSRSNRRRLGPIVMAVDCEAIKFTQDALRHPLLENRLSAIVMADALALVDLLSDSFMHIIRDDHQIARVQAAEVLAHATEAATLELLHELVALPDCQVRDVALRSLERRNASATISIHS